jgi:ribosomal protein S18 acetylase RimI-like enzyme
MRSGEIIAAARTVDDLRAIRALFRDYFASLNLDLSFQDVEAELAALPGKYAPPGGCLLIARDADGGALGCIALRPLASPDECEIKRLYVRPEGRGRALGRRLIEAVLAEARRAGYRLARLDTLATMESAQRLYAGFGFVETAPYYETPIPGTRYLAKALAKLCG